MGPVTMHGCPEVGSEERESWGSADVAERQGLAEPNRCRNRAGMPETKGNRAIGGPVRSLQAPIRRNAGDTAPAAGRGCRRTVMAASNLADPPKNARLWIFCRGAHAAEKISRNCFGCR